MPNPLSRREVLKYGAFTTVGGVLTPGISLAQAITTEGKGLVARDIQLTVERSRDPGLRRPAGGGGPLPDRGGDRGLHRQLRAAQGRGAPLRPGRLLRDRPRALLPRGRHAGEELPGDGPDRGQGDAGPVPERHPRGGRLRQAAVVGARRSPRGHRLLRGRRAHPAHRRRVSGRDAAAVPWYGQVKRTYPDAPGVDAFSLAPRITAPVLGLYGEADPGIPSEDVQRFEAELKRPIRTSSSSSIRARRTPSSRRPAAGLQEGGGGGRLEALPGVLRQTSEILTFGRFAARLSRFSPPLSVSSTSTTTGRNTDDAGPYPLPAEPP